MNGSKPVVLYLLDTLLTGGAEKSLLAITSRFTHFKPVFVTLFDGGHDLLPEYEDAGIAVIRLGLPSSNHFRSIANKVDQLIGELQPVIVHSSIFRSDMVARRLKSEVIIVNSLVNNSYRKRRYQGLPFKSKIMLMGVQLLDRFTLAKVDLMIANSQVLVDSHHQTIGLNRNKTVVIHRGRAIPELDMKDKPDSLSETMQSQTSSSASIWLCVGRLIERKGHKDLLPAFAKLLKTHPNQRLILAGDGEYRKQVEQLIADLELGEAVSLLGTVNHVPELLAQADFFVFPTYFEGLPGSLIEAMIARVPIVCSDIAENNECLKEGMCLFHKVGDQNDLYEKMSEALKLTDWSDRTSKAFDYAAEHFEISKIAKQYEDTYQRLIQEHKV